MITRTVFVAAILMLKVLSGNAQVLKVSDNKRFLVQAGSKPFFWLGDTGWEIIHKLNKEEVAHYMKDRASKGFTVVMAVILAEINGVTDPNAEGQLPFINRDPAKPNEKFFAHVDFIIKEAAKNSLYVGLLPTWGSHMEDKPHPLFENVAPFDEQNAKAYGQFLGKRYNNASNVVWIIGGDRPPDGNENKWIAMAEGIRAGGAKQIMGYHPMGDQSTIDFKEISHLLDFNMIQSGHSRVARNNYDMIATGYQSTPVKPIFDGEPNYEDLPIGFDVINGRFIDFHVRNSAYWSVFAGGFGINYGHNSVWQMYRPGKDTAIVWARIGWREALQDKAAFQLKHLKNLLLSRPFISRIPDQSLIDQPQTERSNHIQVTRDGTRGNKDATYVMVYFAYSAGTSIRTHVIPANKLRAWWFDPRNGTSIQIGEYDNKGSFSVPWSKRILEPQGGPDWVLVIDDASKTYPPPGTITE